MWNIVLSMVVCVIYFTEPYTVLVFHIIQVICSVVEHFGDDEGAFPGGSKLVWTLLIHLENQVPLLCLYKPEGLVHRTTTIIIIG